MSDLALDRTLLVSGIVLAGLWLLCGVGFAASRGNGFRRRVSVFFFGLTLAIVTRLISGWLGLDPRLASAVAMVVASISTLVLLHGFWIVLRDARDRRE